MDRMNCSEISTTRSARDICTIFSRCRRSSEKRFTRRLHLNSERCTAFPTRVHFRRTSRRVWWRKRRSGQSFSVEALANRATKSGSSSSEESFERSVRWTNDDHFWMDAAERLRDVAIPADWQMCAEGLLKILCGDIFPLDRAIFPAQKCWGMIVPVNLVKRLMAEHTFLSGV